MGYKPLQLDQPEYSVIRDQTALTETLAECRRENPDVQLWLETANLTDMEYSKAATFLLETRADENDAESVSL